MKGLLTLSFTASVTMMVILVSGAAMVFVAHLAVALFERAGIERPSPAGLMIGMALAMVIATTLLKALVK